MAVHAIICGGGSGTRMGGTTNKSFILLEGKPVIAYSLELFQNHPQITTITLAMHPEWVQETMRWINRLGITKMKRLVEGGKERQDSVRRALEAVGNAHPSSEDIILVHNAANPLVEEATITECIRAAHLHSASVAGYKVKDTIRKVGEDGKSISTVDRSGLWGMQTPQCIRYGVFVQAHKRAAEEGFLGTDDVQLVERLGIFPAVVDGGYENIKITTPEDILFAQQVIQRRKAKREAASEKDIN
ncbi:MAG: 2-C-methyl-D-erythritol 4-phosphate cytidylyltransferase [Candidatus Diapherotrites archaeon]|nr:2-C-methyl-D-erythritol 4-phosphate cytidylyltransferase [Candidatus Diapherotrites archaeon]MDZ4256358.1 2-C-methyl-D-erythritol 4-phosphate cytidylyltransferase [archaeon]